MVYLLLLLLLGKVLRQQRLRRGLIWRRGSGLPRVLLLMLLLLLHARRRPCVRRRSLA